MVAYEGHVEPDFRERNQTWSDVEAYLASVSSEEYPVGRAARQLILGDLHTQLNQGGDDWHVTGSQVPQLCPDPADAWPADFLPEKYRIVPPVMRELHTIDPASAMARPANDLDLYNARLGTASDDEYTRAVIEAVRAVVPRHGGVGLGGLVRYSMRGVDVAGKGHVVFTIDAQPVDDRGPLGVVPAGGLHSVEVDVKMPVMIQQTSPAQQARRPIVGVELPGLRLDRPMHRSLEDLTSDKAAALACEPGVGDGILAPRFKDVVDLYYIAKTCRLDGDRFRKAWTTNWHWEEAGLSGPPAPFRLYGQSPAQPGERRIDWERGVDELCREVPQLRQYPHFDEMTGLVKQMIDGAADPANKLWIPGRGWQKAAPDSIRDEVAQHLGHAFPPPPDGRASTGSGGGSAGRDHDGGATKRQPGGSERLR